MLKRERRTQLCWFLDRMRYFVSGRILIICVKMSLQVMFRAQNKALVKAEDGASPRVRDAARQIAVLAKAMPQATCSGYVRE